ncbi:MAG: thioredoxin family protein [Pseudomonadota bacterium]
MKRLLTVIAALFMGVQVQGAEIGDDGLHKTTWMRDTFKDLSEDLDEANAEGKRLMVMIEQRGCIYCKKMHEEILVRPEIANYIEEHFFVVQINMFGDVEVTDFDGITMAEKDMVQRWDVLFTPNIFFFPEEVEGDAVASQVAVTNMPGAFGPSTTLSMLRWVVEKRYEGGEPFQKYHARRLEEEGG